MPLVKTFIVMSVLSVVISGAGCGDTDADRERPKEPGVVADPSSQYSRGAEVFVEYCAACHREDGTGIGNIYPPLKGSDYLGNREKTIESVVNGLDGELEVNGTTYNAMMPPLPPAYSDEDAAEVINYMMARFADSSWTTTTEEVSSVRE